MRNLKSSAFKKFAILFSLVGLLSTIGVGMASAATPTAVITKVKSCVKAKTHEMYAPPTNGVCPTGTYAISWGDANAMFGKPRAAVQGKGEQCTVGEVILSATNVVNGVPATGQKLSITSYQALYQLMGTQYGGDGKTYFQLPDLRSITPNGLVYSICVFGVYPAKV